MDLTRLAVDAGQLINRAVQYTGENLGQTEKTELDPGLEELLNRADATKSWTDKLISQTEVLLQPNPGARLEDRLYEHLDWSAPPRPRAHEVLGDLMTQAGLEIGSNTPYGTALLRCGEVQKQLGRAEREFVQSTNIHFLSPLRSFTEGDYRLIQDERRMLLNKRLDLDITKTRLRKAHEADQQARNLNANPLEDDYFSHVSYMFSFLRVKWLKMWAQEISQAEMELRICQSLFDRQSEDTRRVLEGIGDTHNNHMRSLTEFVEAQACYFNQCNQHAQEVQKQLASIPAVLCSNNWQSAYSNAVNQPSAVNHAASDPSIVVHHLPDFDQDSWTTSSHPGTENTPTDSSMTTRPLDQTNNNNNNASFTGSQAARFRSGIDSQSFSSQTFDHVSISESDGRPADQHSAPNWTVNTRLETTATEPPASRPTSPQPSQLSAPVDEFQTANAAGSETRPTSDVASETAVRQPTADGDVIQESS